MAGITVTDPSHPSHLVAGFVAMRNAGELFDYVIRGSDESFSIHSLVLASMSPVFKTMLGSGMEESVKREATFPTIPDAIMRTIIDFAYSGTCTFTRDELMTLIIAAHFLEMSTLLKFCTEQIFTLLQPSNCFSWARFAERLQLKTIMPQIQNMMFTSYKAVIQSEEFQDVEMSEIIDYLRSLIKKDIHSDTVLEAALTWIKHDSSTRSVHMPELFKCVSISKCTKRFLAKVVEENATLLEAEQDMYKLLLTETLTEEHDDLIVLGGQSKDDVPNIDCWMCKDDHLVKFAEMPGEQLRRYHSICQIPQGVMFTGGEGSDMCKLFDVTNASWLDKANLSSMRSDHGSGYLSGKVYVVAGYVNDSLSQNVDYMDLDTDTWQPGPDLPEDGFLPKVAVCDTRLFALLTKTGTLYCLECGFQSWTKKSELPKSSFGCNVAAVDDKMFAVGGDKNINYMYVPNADTWCRLTGPSLTERQGALVYFKQKIYLIGGCKRDDKLTAVEEYDIRTDTWSLAAWKLPRPLYMHAAFVVNVPR